MSVDLICLRDGKREPSREIVNGVNILRLPIPKRRGGKIDYLLQYSAFGAACFMILAFRSLRKRYDIVHVDNMPDFLVFSGLVPRLFGSKVMLDLHDPDAQADPKHLRNSFEPLAGEIADSLRTMEHRLRRSRFDPQYYISESFRGAWMSLREDPDRHEFPSGRIVRSDAIFRRNDAGWSAEALSTYVSRASG